MADRVFEIGLVLAGAVSGGAYTAGVLDFLFDALDDYERRREPSDHRVCLRVITGASAGAMCAGLAVRALMNRATRSPLYEAWVERISIEKLLRTIDLDAHPNELVSLLDSWRRAATKAARSRRPPSRADRSSRSGASSPRRFASTTTRSVAGTVTIIPLRGALAEPVPLPCWPSWSKEDERTLGRGLCARTNAAVPALGGRSYLLRAALLAIAREAQPHPNRCSMSAHLLPVLKRSGETQHAP